MERSIISHVVGEQSKGERLQRLRAIRLIFEELEKSNSICVLVACEHLEDVYMHVEDTEGTQKEYIESDKSYESKPFSLNSDEVKNSVVSFLDCWLRHGKGIRFGFYTNTTITNERSTDLLKRENLELPDMPLLELLISKRYDEVLPFIKCIVMDDYEKQYARNKHKTGYFDVIQVFTDEMWIQFCNQIDWRFEQEDENELELFLLEKVKTCSLYTSITVSGREQYIIDALDKELERRQGKTDPIHRMINTDTVRNKFLEVGTNTTSKSLDPCYEEWELMDKPFDARGIIQKILEVSPEYDPQMFEIFARKIGTIKKQLLRTNHQERGAYLYRVFEACEEKLIRVIRKQIQKHDVEPPQIEKRIVEPLRIKKHNAEPLRIQEYDTEIMQIQEQDVELNYDAKFKLLKSQMHEVVSMPLEMQKHDVEPPLIDEFIEILVHSAKSHLDDWGKDYEYPFKSESALRDTIYELFDTCYLAFD
ncbi:hypothetical protein [Paenibacillus wynnii]|uniref:CD-NTase associated protein 4-like DNA endonuclease domain-containing protein n=1 Tax=Paenibacillus wynnii TaxID=268407 RepID=A0A098M5A3_9BACL|nr:hypothetical protein [Paenibacillus wynnii]KGE17226.1 hypothetical protein PWYN_21600 [Paenibacillus wynnii]